MHERLPSCETLNLVAIREETRAVLAERLDLVFDTRLLTPDDHEMADRLMRMFSVDERAKIKQIISATIRVEMERYVRMIADMSAART